MSPSANSPSGNSPSANSPNGNATGELTVTGQVEAGVEAGCFIMKAGDATYLLVGGDRSMVQAGRRITVRGRLNPGLMTTCQQGTPLQISEVRAA